MSATTFGDYAKEDISIDFDEGEYRARIVKAVIPRDPATGECAQSFEKTLCDVTFAIDGNEADVIKRRYAISFGQNVQTGQWAAFAQLLTAACGVPCGAADQRLLRNTDLEGKWVRVILQRQEKNGRSYLNVANVLPPKRT